MIYPALNTKLNTILGSVSEIASVFAYPTTKIDSYPAAIFYPSTFENSFETTSENFKVYGYKLWIVVNAQGTTVENVFAEIMPKTLDAVLQKLDDEWDFNTIDGHRVWTKVDTGGWTVAEENAGVEVTAELDLSVKMLTDVS